uniref:Antitoxin YefM n=1 Tax=Candidatus Kentrum sp. LFY TaxID=2126342 RepID=A0A450WYF9_9GAMM|nr:MAG: antitoxin YefM [Candidatus Kentron sp. LFY]
MHTTYHLNADELNLGFLDVLKTQFKHKTIGIAVWDAEQDETAYLLDNPANRARLLEAVENVANKRNLVSVDLGDMADEDRF